MIERKRKIGIVGAGPEGLEILGLLYRDKTLELSFMVDPNRDALGFSLKDYGFAFSENLNLRLSNSLTEIPQDLDLIIDTSSDPKIRKELHSMDLPETDIIGSPTAHFLWELRLLEAPGELYMKKARQSLCRKRIDDVLDAIDLTIGSEEFFYLLLYTAMETTKADAGSIMLIDEEGSLRVEFFCGNPEFDISKARAMPIKIGKGISGRAAALGEPLLLSGSFDDLRQDHLYRDTLSAMCVPLKDDEEKVVGVLNVGSGSIDAFIQEDLIFLSNLVSRIGIYLKKIMTVKEIQDVSLEQALYKDIHSILELNESVNERLQKAATCMAERLKISSCSIYLKDQRGDLNLQASVGICPKVFGLMSFKGNRGIIGRTFLQGSPTLLQETLLYGAGMRKSLKGLLCLPLFVADKGIGVILLEFTSTKDLTPRKMRLLQEIGNLLAITIKDDMERQRMSQKVLKLSVVNEEGLALISTMERVKVLKLAVASAAMITEAEIALLKLIDPLSKELLLASAYGLQKDQAEKDLIELDRRIAERVRKSGHSLLIPDIPNSEFRGPSLYQSGLMVPITEEDQLQGTLSIYNKLSYTSFSTTVFSDDDKEILERYAHYVSKALKNLQNYLNKEALITIDDLTRLRNERYLRLRLPEEIKRADRHKRNLSLLFIDVEHFEDLSKTMDPISMREFLKEIAQALRDTFRNIDVIARLRGAKFAVLMPDTGEQVDLAIERLKTKAGSLKLNDKHINLLIGHATYSCNGQSVKEFISKAAKLRTL